MRRVLIAILLVFSACQAVRRQAGRLADGVYTGTSAPDDTGAHAEVTLTIECGGVKNVKFVTLQKDGKVKDSDYGKVNGEVSNPAFYEKAQTAVRAMKTYEEAFKTSGRLDAVDAISGATVSYNQFLEAASAALERAQSKRTRYKRARDTRAAEKP